MLLKCDACAASIEAKDVDEARGLARCSYCGAVLDLGPRAAAGSPAAAFRERPEVPMPKGISLSREGGGLVVVRRWFSWKYLPLVFFCVVWDGFLLFWYAAALGVGSRTSARGDLPFMLLFPLIHVAVGAGLTYFTLAGILNSTRVAVAGGRLTIRHGPLPWPGNLDQGTGEVRQLFTTQKVTRGKNGETITYELGCLGPGGARKTLLKGMEAVEQALYLEQRLERHLRIEDREVPGEAAR